MARIGFLVSHPIQYYTPIFRALAKQCALTVFFAHRQTAEQQAQAGFGVTFDWDVDLLSGYESRFLVNVSRRPSTERFGGCDTPGIAAEIAGSNFDAFVVPGWALRSYWQAARACRRLGVPVLVRGDSHLGTRRNGALWAAKAFAFPYLLRRFDGFLYVGQRNREYLRHYGVPENRLFFSPHCVDNDAFAAASVAARGEASAGQRRARRRVLFVGKLLARKHPTDLLHAVARLAEHRVEVIFAGSGDLEVELRQVAATLALPVKFLGFVNQSQLPAVYASADVLVLPSDGRETWGLVVNEAMACGLPAIVSDAVGCGPDLVEPGATGAIFPLGDIAALAAAIESVLSLDADHVRRRLAAKIALYAPARAASAIVEAATTLARRAGQP
jgi:glycosyltransferase involved in cell wall biosynthesis